jgi:hypothetical protein
MNSLKETSPTGASLRASSEKSIREADLTDTWTALCPQRVVV